MLEVLPAEGGANGCRRRRVADAGEIAGSDRSDDGGWRQGCDGHELSSPIDGMGHSRGWQPGSKVSMMIMRPPQQGQAFMDKRSTRHLRDDFRYRRSRRSTGLG